MKSLNCFIFLTLAVCASLIEARPKYRPEYLDGYLNDPCSKRACPKGSQCYVNSTTNLAECMCRPYCKPHVNPVCGSDGVLYDNHCELHRAACLIGRHISIMHDVTCSRATTPVPVTPAASSVEAQQQEEQMEEVVTQPKPVQTTTVRSEVIEDEPSTEPQIIVDQNEKMELAEEILASVERICLREDLAAYKKSLMHHYKEQFKNPDEEKDTNLPQPDARLLVSSIFNHLDTSRDTFVDEDELELSRSRDNIANLSENCCWEDLLLKFDKDADGRFSAQEMYDAFGIESVKIAPHLKEKSVTVTVGDNLVIPCEITAHHDIAIVWDRNGGRLKYDAKEGINYYGDGRLYFVNMKMFYMGTYTCYAELYPEVKQTYTIYVQVPPSVKVCPHNQLKPKGTTGTVQCYSNGLPEPVKTWKRNNNDLGETEKFELTDANSTMKVHNIDYADTGIFECTATNEAGNDKISASVFIRDSSTDLDLGASNIFYFFHKTGIQIVQPDTCGFQESFKGTDKLPDSADTLCQLNKTSGAHECNWGDAVNVNNHFIYATQPHENKIIVIDVMAKRIVEVIQTENVPVGLTFIQRLNSIWVECWRTTAEQASGRHSVEVIRYADAAPPHYPIHIEPEGQHFDLVDNVFIPPLDQFEGQGDMNYGYLVHKNEQGMTKVNLEDLTHGGKIDLSTYDCHPNSVAFMSLGGYALVNCDGHHGPGEKQLFVDYITDKVVKVNDGVKGQIYISPDGRYVISVDMAEQHIQVQKVSDTGKLTTSFQVSTNLHISDLGFFPALTTHSYDLYATSRVRQDIIYINLDSGKVEMIPDVHKPIEIQNWPWDSRNRKIVSSGDFGPYMVSPGEDHIVILNGPLHRVHCDVDNIKNANVMAWVGVC